MSMAIPYRVPTVIKSAYDYKDVLEKYKSNKSSRVYRIEYFHNFYGDNYMKNMDSKFTHELTRAVTYLSSQIHITQFVVNNGYGSFARNLFDINYDKGVLFYRNNEMVDYMKDLDFDNFRQIVYNLDHATPKHSPKKVNHMRNSYNYGIIA